MTCFLGLYEKKKRMMSSNVVPNQESNTYWRSKFPSSLLGGGEVFVKRPIDVIQEFFASSFFLVSWKEKASAAAVKPDSLMVYMVLLKALSCFLALIRKWPVVSATPWKWGRSNNCCGWWWSATPKQKRDLDHWQHESWRKLQTPRIHELGRKEAISFRSHYGNERL